jgi:hypothetical protein
MARQLGLGEAQTKRILWPWARCIDQRLQEGWEPDEIMRLVRWGLDAGYTIDGPRAFFDKAHRIRQHLKNSQAKNATAEQSGWL